jgi:hypothetical protein
MEKIQDQREELDMDYEEVSSQEEETRGKDKNDEGTIFITQAIKKLFIVSIVCFIFMGIEVIKK